jgi:glycerol-3-phosphate acyltransferase PlsY
MLWIFLVVLAYLLGSIPSAVWVSKGFHGVDVREYGSKNAGATNTFRVLGKKTGTVVLLLDILKGFTAANLSLFLPDNHITWKLVFGLAAVVGHLYPVFAGFKGGKGVATLLGLVFSIHPIIALICIGFFLVVLLVTKMVSAGSILSTLLFTLLVYAFFGLEEPVLLYFGIFAAGLVLYTHRANLIRIWNNEEKKIFLIKPKEK